MSLLQRLRLAPSAPYRRPADLSYGADDCPPPAGLAGLALQHCTTALALIAYVLAMSHLAGLALEQTRQLVAASVLGMALATGLQAWGRRTGAGQLIVHIPDPNQLTVLAVLVAQFGPGAMVAAGLLHGGMGLLVAQGMPRLRALLPPTVAGLVAMMGGFALAAPGLAHLSGSTDAAPASGPALLVGVLTLATVVALSVWGSQKTRLYALLGGLAAGLAAAALTGQLRGGEMLAAAPFFALPSLAAPVFDVDPGLLVSVALLSVLVQLDTLGTVALMDKMNNADWRRTNMRQVAGAIRAGSLGNIATSALGAYPTATSSASIALSHISRCTSRYVGLAVALMLGAIAFLPQATLALTLIPTPIIGAVEVYAAAYLIVSGIELVASRAMDARAIFMVGLSFVAGIAVMVQPELAAQLPESLRFLAANGIITAGLAAIGLNLLFRIGVSQRKQAMLDPRAGIAVTEQIIDTVELWGGQWQARREVLKRAAAAALEAAEFAAAGGRQVVALRGSFDEFHLVVELVHNGTPLAMGGADAAMLAQLLDADDAAFDSQIEQALSHTSRTLLRRLAERVETGTRAGQSYLRLTFDH
ncbi:solute carrier family 23 protein [Orrella sp. JC864]|uniref:solute carrier family 23 protein n=1 Tax=Orrella sp. JC864 TaxID=3120298 RepID=UPI0012BCF485